jgi:RNA polymerase sigma factor (TIGR02999 family)
MPAALPSADAVTTLLGRVREGDAEALGRVVEQLYAELRQAAHQQRFRGHAAETVNTTALVHEAYAKLAARAAPLDLSDREHFIRTAALAMRSVIVDYARAQSAERRGGSGKPRSLDGLAEVLPGEGRLDIDQALSVDAALARLTALDEEAARVAELRYFGGLTNEETAEAVGLSPATVKRRWSVARAFLARELRDA